MAAAPPSEQQARAPASGRRPGAARGARLRASSSGPIRRSCGQAENDDDPAGHGSAPVARVFVAGRRARRTASTSGSPPGVRRRNAPGGGLSPGALEPRAERHRRNGGLQRVLDWRDRGAGGRPRQHVLDGHGPDAPPAFPPSIPRMGTICTRRRPSTECVTKRSWGPTMRSGGMSEVGRPLQARASPRTAS